MTFLGDFVTNEPEEWGRDYSDDLAKSSESKDVTKLQMSEAKKVHDDLMKRITEFYNKKKQWGLITNDKHEVKKLKSIAPNLRIMPNKTDLEKSNQVKRIIAKI